MSDPRFVAIAEVARPHGLKGELRLKIYNPDSQLLLSRPRVRLVQDGKPRDVKIRAARAVPKALLVWFEGVNDRDAAEALKGASVEVLRDTLSATDEDEFYFCDLEGAQVQLTQPGGEFAKIGVVRSVARYPTCDCLVIKRPAATLLEVPLHGEYIDDIDVAAGLITLRHIEGLE